jgi:cytochrome c biogenesis protein CcmG/thiol:disulfide interchange protein DsbE
MKILLKLIILILPASFILMFFLLLTEDDSIIGADYRQFALPQFNLEELDGSSFITSSDLGDTYIINVWASWCITCRIEHPYLMSLNKKGIPVIGLNYKDEENDALEWLSRFGNPYKKIIHDYKGTLALDLGVTGAPETFLVNNGKIIAHYQGEINESIWSQVFIPIIKEKELF